jgi:hypothetical protein
MKRTTSERMSRRCCRTTWIMSAPLKTRKPSADFFKHLRLLLLVVPRSCLWTVISIKPWFYCKDYWKTAWWQHRELKKATKWHSGASDLLNSIKQSYESLMKVSWKSLFHLLKQARECQDEEAQQILQCHQSNSSHFTSCWNWFCWMWKTLRPQLQRWCIDCIGIRLS